MISNILLLASLFASFSGVAFASEGVLVPPSYIGGNAFNRFAEAEKVMYVMGVLDGMRTGLALSDQQMVDWFDACLKGKPSGQMLAIVNKWMTEHPDQWNYSMDSLVWQSVIGFCKFPTRK